MVNMKILWNYFVKGMSHSYENTKCFGYPEVFAIELTNHCPMDCVMCPRKNMKRKLGHMDFDLFKKAINQIKGYSDWVWLHDFGDPLVHPKFDEFIKYAKKKGIKTRLSTNPILLTEKNVERILDSGLDFLHMSLDGVNPKTYREMRGKNADYSIAEKNIKLLIRKKKESGLKKPFVRLGIIHMESTKNEIVDFKKAWSIPGIDEIEVKDYVTWDGSNKDIIKLAGKAFLSKEFKDKNKRACRQPWFHVVILWDGRVVPCCYDYDAKYVMGDLNKESLKKIWNNNRVRQLRRQHIRQDFKHNTLCINCKEKQSLPTGKLYPFNLIFDKDVLKGIKERFKKWN